MLLKLLMLAHFSSVLLNVGHWNLSVWGKDHFQLKGDNLCFTNFLMLLWDGVVSSTGANSAQVCCDFWCWRNSTADDLEGHTKAGELQNSVTLHPTASWLGRKWLQLDSLYPASLNLMGTNVFLHLKGWNFLLELCKEKKLTPLVGCDVLLANITIFVYPLLHHKPWTCATCP